ncbi:FMN reductase (EC 1.5.1.29) (plasmid) [Mycetohabitans rhizoxinica HKI 454]|uniref:FMN reductase n=1 Tax=Mycetohabitans rhizoxinica (strain DSM 19002 / CIP 109453 / HKI 454) TaxID=882378 RepID=E5AUS4_MYCRK|nr:FMN reductase (EC 1.5.1.29) [Mycetohabitans rhizoxinica HKI 454]
MRCSSHAAKHAPAPRPTTAVACSITRSHARRCASCRLRQIPWNELRDDAVVSMLERYVIERSEDLLSANSGTLQPPHAAS